MTVVIGKGMVSKVTNALVGYFITSYPTRAHGIIVVYFSNRIYNKILDRDWFSARLFVT